jgi:hypothetical protein
MTDTNTTPADPTADVAAAIERLRSAAGAAASAPLAPQLQAYRRLVHSVTELLVRVDRSPELDDEEISNTASARRVILEARDRLAEVNILIGNALATVESRPVK